QSLSVEIDGTTFPLALGFLALKTPNPALLIEVAGLNNAGLLGTATRFPKDRKEVTEGPVLHERQERVELLLSDVRFARRRRGHFNIGDGGSRDDALFPRPVEGTLYRPNG